MKITFFVFVMVLVSCQQTAYKERDRNVYFHPMGGGVSFILPEVPTWANASSEGGCFKNPNLRFIDLGKMKKEFNLSMRANLNVQYYLNEELEVLRSKVSSMNEESGKIGLQEQEQSFFKALEKARSNFEPLKLPDFGEYHLVWYDEWIATSSEEKLKAFLKSSVHDTGVPVVFSLCLSQEDLEKKFQELGVYSFGAEWSTSFNEEGRNSARFGFYLKYFFNENKKIVFYPHNKKNINNAILIGKYEVR